MVNLLFLAHGIVETQAALGNIAGVLLGAPPLLYPGASTPEELLPVDVGSQALFAFGTVPYLIHAFSASPPPRSLSLGALLYHTGLAIGGFYRLARGLPIMGHSTHVVDTHLNRALGHLNVRDAEGLRAVIGVGGTLIHVLLGIAFFRSLFVGRRKDVKGKGKRKDE